MSTIPSYDANVAVIGLGSMGSFAFWQLAKAKQNVIGFERYQPGHDQGAGHGETRIFRTAYGEGVEYVPLLQEARKLWREIESETSTELYIETGGTMFGLKGDTFIKNVQESVQQYHLPHKGWSGIEAKKVYPQINFKADHVVIHEKHAGFIKPELAIQTAITRGEQLGGIAYNETEVKEIKPNEKGVTIVCNNRVYRVKKAIVSAGGWTTQLLPQLNLPLTIERQVLVWYSARSPKDFIPKKFPIFSRMKEGIGFYGFPSVDGKTVKVALHHGGEIVNHPSEVDREIYDTDLAPVTELVKQYLPGLIPEPVRAKTCFYTNTLDEHFILGHVQNVPNITLLGPMAGHGFKFAPVMGKIAAQLATDQTPSLSIRMFDPNRFYEA